MGQTNLKQALERKYSLMAGELQENQGEVARVQPMYEMLPVLSKLAVRLRHLMGCAEELLKEIDPAWVRGVRSQWCRTSSRRLCQWERSRSAR